MKKNFVFFGTPKFAAVILEKLIQAGFVPSAVVCNPDRPVGRKKVVTPPPVKKSVMGQVSSVKSKIQVLQPEKLDEGFKFQVSSFKSDFFVVSAYAKIIPKEFLDIPPLGTIGVHPSLLPKHRGASPIQETILRGDKETGVTLYLLDEKVDHGPILANRKLQIANSDSYEILAKKLAKLGGDLLVETLPKFLAGEIKPQAQDESEATYTKKFTTEDAFVSEVDLDRAISGDSSGLAISIERKIRAFDPEPGVWTIRNGKRTKLLGATLENGKLILKKIQIEGKKPTMV